jgi:hypothetical protein
LRTGRGTLAAKGAPNTPTSFPVNRRYFNIWHMSPTLEDRSSTISGRSLLMLEIRLDTITDWAEIHQALSSFFKVFHWKNGLIEDQDT